MDEGFIEATSHNLPTVDLDAVFNYFRSNPDFRAPELRNVKTTKDMRESYGNSAVGFIQLRRIDNVCIVKAKITPEHKIHQSPYRVEAEINEEENIVNKCVCLDCSASSGGCKHSIAFLLWLHRRSEEPSVTSVKSYWQKSKLSKVGSTIKFMSLGDISSKPMPPLPIIPPNFLEEVLMEGKNVGAQGTLFQHVVQPDPISRACLHRLHCQYRQENRDRSAEDFVKFVSHRLSGICDDITNLTVKQNKTAQWYTVRYGRITASKLYEISRCQSVDGELVKHILGGCKPIETAAIKRGIRLEHLVKQKFEERYNVKIKDAGFFIRKDHPIFGASPDGLTATHSIEIKCPFKSETVKNYISEDGVIQAKPYAQIQLQMYLSGRKSGYFIVASPNFEKNHNFQVVEVHLDEEFLFDIMNRAETFWKQAVYPKL